MDDFAEEIDAVVKNKKLMKLLAARSKDRKTIPLAEARARLNGKRKHTEHLPGATIMTQTITAHFDGKVIVPDKPVKLPVGKPLLIQVVLAPAGNGKKSRKRIKITGMGQFDSGISDLGSNKKHLEGLGKK